MDFDYDGQIFSHSYFLFQHLGLVFFGTSTNVRHSKNYKVNKLFSVVGTANLLTLVDR